MRWFKKLFNGIKSDKRTSASDGRDPATFIGSEAQEHFQRGRMLGQAGRYNDALSAFSEAARLEPTWPAPVYDAAFSYLLMGRPQEALENYEKVDQLQPGGFFTAKTAIWVLRRELSGQYPAGTYQKYVSIEWAQSELEKLEIARALTSSLPDFAPAWKEMAVHSDDPELRQDFINRGLACQPDPETDGMLRLNKLAMLRQQGNDAAADAVLAELLQSPTTTLANRSWAQLLRENP